MKKEVYTILRLCYTENMASNTVNIHKLQSALNQKGMKILYSTSQFYSTQQDRPITIYTIKQATFDETKKKSKAKELFSSTSQLQILLFLRDMWYEVNGWEVPTDNEMWEEVKAKMRQKEDNEDV